MTSARRPLDPAKRRSCSCGAGMTADGTDTAAAARLLDGFDRDHAGPGHQPVRRALSQEGRAPRKKGRRSNGQ